MPILTLTSVADQLRRIISMHSQCSACTGRAPARLDPHPKHEALHAVRHAAIRAAGASIALIALGSTDLPAEPARVQIVGLGAASCAEFMTDISATPVLHREYLAWAQGFMSAILLSRPPGVDEKLNLLPPNLALVEQLRFLREQCSGAPERRFSNVVEALYKHLRQIGGT